MSRAMRTEVRFYAMVGKVVTILAVGLLCLMATFFATALTAMAWQDYSAQERHPYAWVPPDSSIITRRAR